MNPIPELWTQFCIARANVRVNLPEGWKSTPLHNWVLHYSNTTFFNVITTSDGSPVGWLVGYSMDSSGKRIEGNYQSLLVLNQFKDAARVDELLLDIEGRFLLVLVHPEIEKVYMNTGGDLSAVYRKDIAVVASTPTAAHLDNLSQFVEEYRAKPELPANKYYPGGPTCSPDTNRIPPNHYLDLKTRTIHRYWPTDALPEMDAKEHDKVAADLAKRLKSRIESYSQIAPLTCGISAGRDCRMILAAGKNVIDRLHFYTFCKPSADQPWDEATGKYIAKKFHINHKSLDIVEAPDAIKQEYLFRVGYSNNSGKANDFYFPLKNNYPQDWIMLVGYGGEVLRAQYYMNFTPTERPDVNKLMQIIKQAPTAENLAAVEAWINSMPKNLSAPMFYDLIYWELRFGCWAAPQMYGAAPCYTFISPMTHGKFLRKYMTQSVADKHAITMYKKMILHNWPELLDVPLNDLVGWPRTWRRIKGVPGRTVGKVKRLFSSK